MILFMALMSFLNVVGPALAGLRGKLGVLARQRVILPDDAAGHSSVSSAKIAGACAGFFNSAVRLTEAAGRAIDVA
jgi:hypothetical protein